MRRFKSFAILALIICMGAAIVGCSNSKMSQEELTQTGIKAEYGEEGTNINITSAYITTDYEGDRCVVVCFDWTNASNSSVRPSNILEVGAKQGKNELELTSTYSNEGDNYYIEAAAGDTVSIEVPFKISNNSKVTFELSDTSDNNDDNTVVSATLKLRNFEEVQSIWINEEEESTTR